MMQSRVQLSMAWCRDAVVQVLFLVVAVPGLLAGYAPSAAVGDLGEFLVVYVDPFARVCFWWWTGLGLRPGGPVAQWPGRGGAAAASNSGPGRYRASSAGAILRVSIASGKFQGVMR